MAKCNVIACLQRCLSWFVSKLSTFNIHFLKPTFQNLGEKYPFTRQSLASSVTSAENTSFQVNKESGVNTKLSIEGMFHHEFRTPLTVTLGQLCFLKKEPLTTQQLQYVNIISESAHSLLTLINQVCSSQHSNQLDRFLRVLMVEDNPLIQQIHSHFLSTLRCDITVASNASEALSFRAKEFDLILLDIGLPDMNGIDLARVLRRQPHHIKTRMIAITAYADESIIKKCQKIGIEQVLHKPVSFEKLAALIHQSF